MSTALNTRPDRGQVRVTVGSIGLSALGTQVSGTVEAVAKDSIGFIRGDRVAFAMPAPPKEGRIIVEERDLMGVPADVGLDAAAALFPCASLARTVVRQVHAVGAGASVYLRGESALSPFLRSWIRYLGAVETDNAASADIVIIGSDIRTARAWGVGHGVAQQAAADVFEAIRAGAFDDIALSTPEQARQGSRTPVLLHPAEVDLAA